MYRLVAWAITKDEPRGCHMARFSTCVYAEPERLGMGGNAKATRHPTELGGIGIFVTLLCHSYKMKIYLYVAEIYHIRFKMRIN